MINTAFCQDLIQTLKNPFEPTRARFIKYIIVCTITPIIIIIGVQSSFEV